MQTKARQGSCLVLPHASYAYADDMMI